jgi:hypothetical protein
MKKSLFVLLLIAAACNTQPCEDITCLNGGYCETGDCQCPPQYEYESCEQHIYREHSRGYMNEDSLFWFARFGDTKGRKDVIMEWDVQFTDRENIDLYTEAGELIGHGKLSENGCVIDYTVAGVEYRYVGTVVPINKIYIQAL